MAEFGFIVVDESAVPDSLRNATSKPDMVEIEAWLKEIDSMMIPTWVKWKSGEDK